VRASTVAVVWVLVGAALYALQILRRFAELA
jgi:hypothetical protein